MTFKRSASFSFMSLTLGAAAVLTLSGCAGEPVGKIKGQFWQRTGSSEAIYMQGPKAQQILNRDIARCVTELRELERLGALKNAIPTDMTGHVLTEEEIELSDWDTPEREKELFAEHSDYADFESCMQAKGWERVEHVPYDVARKGRENYLKAHVDYKADYKDYSTQRSEKITTQTHGDYSDLNEFKAPSGKGMNE